MADAAAPDKNANGSFDVGVGPLHASGKGRDASMYLIAMILALALGGMLYFSWEQISVSREGFKEVVRSNESFHRLRSAEHDALLKTLQCHIYIAAPVDIRRQLQTPECLRWGHP